jgi:hypothetical protein
VQANGRSFGLFAARSLACGAKLVGWHGIKNWLDISYYEL